MTIAGMLAERFDGPDAPSQTDAARSFDVSQATVSRWISGRLLPGRDKVTTLARFLGVTESEVIEAVQRQAAQAVAEADRNARAAAAAVRLKKAQYGVVESLRKRTRAQTDALLELGEAIDEVLRLLPTAPRRSRTPDAEMMDDAYEASRTRRRQRPGAASRDVG